MNPEPHLFECNTKLSQSPRGRGLFQRAVSWQLPGKQPSSPIFRRHSAHTRELSVEKADGGSVSDTPIARGYAMGGIPPDAEGSKAARLT